jgi:hypothetical protein
MLRVMATRDDNARRRRFDDPNCQAAIPRRSGLAVFILRVVDGPVRDAG